MHLSIGSTTSCVAMVTETQSIACTLPLVKHKSAGTLLELKITNWDHFCLKLGTSCLAYLPHSREFSGSNPCMCLCRLPPALPKHACFVYFRLHLIDHKIVYKYWGGGSESRWWRNFELTMAAQTGVRWMIVFSVMSSFVDVIDWSANYYFTINHWFCVKMQNIYRSDPCKV